MTCEERPSTVIRKSAWKKIFSYLDDHTKARVSETLDNAEVMHKLEKHHFGLIDYLEHFGIKLTLNQFLECAPRLGVV